MLFWEDYMEYHRYLKEVVQALESDSEFRERLEKADQEDVRSGKVAEQLDFVNHNVRSKLNEIKRRELVRLRHLATKQYELSNNLDVDSVHSPSHEHLDNKNLHTFEIEDLKKLIKKTTSDLEEIDKRRKQEFKYSLTQPHGLDSEKLSHKCLPIKRRKQEKVVNGEKEFEKHQKLESLDEQHKKEYQERLEQDEKVKKEHRP
ncbi:Nucleobindin-1, partial [Eumeta japonica]